VGTQNAGDGTTGRLSYNVQGKETGMTNDNSSYCVVMTSIGSEAQANALAKQLLAERLAACVQIQQVRSHYIWQDKACDEAESLLFIKTRSAQYEQLEHFIRAHHPYEVPEIIQLPVTAGFSAYLRWIDASTGG
jgi:periplasmic divalent cation tolerance protein